jgi:inosine/xanthosine triphosphate pyrophosphatase family protein
MKVLLGTTNPSKVRRFSKLLENCDIEFITLKDLEIEDEPDETGRKCNMQSRILWQIF